MRPDTSFVGCKRLPVRSVLIFGAERSSPPPREEEDDAGPTYYGQLRQPQE
jgi:hypothetical protein